MRGYNRFATPAAPPTATSDYSDIPTYSAVRVNTYRFTAGVDYALTRTSTCFLRYNYFDYDDTASPLFAGAAHMFLGGLSAVY